MGIIRLFLKSYWRTLKRKHPTRAAKCLKDNNSKASILHENVFCIFFRTFFKVICIGKEKATASTEKNLRKATVKPTGNIVSERVTTQKKERVTATATHTTLTVIRMVSLSQISIKDCYKLVIVLVEFSLLLVTFHR